LYHHPTNPIKQVTGSPVSLQTDINSQRVDCQWENGILENNNTIGGKIGSNRRFFEQGKTSGYPISGFHEDQKA
jgi:hypothetical protein